MARAVGLAAGKCDFASYTSEAGCVVGAAFRLE